ncbi:MAG TPA: SsrA-binding protein SmpB, partial [Synergistales bacterium]|nr:SsrA-binding protein SmpB [Synergistales bacterium]
MDNRTVATNRKARHDYFILETFECGIMLTGTEIKSVREGRVNLKEGYATIKDGEIWLFNVHISPYEKGSFYNHEPLRPRKLLMHKREIMRLMGKVKEKGLTMVPLSMYIKEGKR